MRSRADYEAWYPVFGASGLVVPTWPVAYGGLDLSRSVARAIEAVLAPYNLGRLNPLGLNLAAPALFAHGTEEQRLRFLPPIVRNEEVWCQLFSEPGAGCDLASLATRAERDGDEWVVTGQKVWTTWAHVADFGVLLARTDPRRPKRKGITYFLVDLHQPGVDVRPLRHITGEIDFNEVFLDGARVPDSPAGRRGRRRLAGGQRHPVGRAPDGVGLRLGRRRPHRRVGGRAPRPPGGRTHGATPTQRQAIVGGLERGAHPGLDQPAGPGRPQGGPLARSRELHRQGPPGRAQPAHPAPGHRPARRRRHGVAGTSATGSWSEALPYEVKGMLRSRANTIEGGTTEVNKNIVAERVLGLPREPDPWHDAAWRDVPR